MSIYEILLTILCTSLYTGASAQSLKTVDSLVKEYQTCLDTKNMRSCTGVFYGEMDDMLNAVYKSLRNTCDSMQKNNLKDEQLEWLAKRDAYFKKVLVDYQKQNPDVPKDYSKWGEYDDMITIDEKASFVKERVIALIKQKPGDYSPANYHVDPTGFYDLDNKTEKKNGDTFGYFGDIEVKLLNDSKVAIRLFVCKGAPSYNSGEATDTLTIKNNRAVYTTEDDTTCRLVFTFYRRGIMIDQWANDPNFACGFGHGVVAYGFYKKTSWKTPTNKELMAE